MFINSSLATHHKNKAKTEHTSAWKNGYYETYRLNETIPAARLHMSSRKCGGAWFALDAYDVSIEAFHSRLALVDKSGKAATLKNPSLDRYLLAPGTIVNVGLAKSQGQHHGGGWQVEYVSGPAPVLLEHLNNPKHVTM